MRSEGCFEILCGDGIISSPEECDDGNLVNLDGCSKYCIKERDSNSTGNSTTTPNNTIVDLPNDSKNTSSSVVIITQKDSSTNDGFKKATITLGVLFGCALILLVCLFSTKVFFILRKTSKKR